MDDFDKQLSRRGFLKGAGILAAATAVGPLILPRRLFGANAPSGQINIAMIGMGRQMMNSNLAPFLQSPDCQVVAVCDVDAWRLEQGLSAVNKYYAQKRPSGTWNGCKAYKDFREVLARTDIDAIFISTPDHWHAPMAIAAIRAGKEVGVQSGSDRSNRAD